MQKTQTFGWVFVWMLSGWIAIWMRQSNLENPQSTWNCKESSKCKFQSFDPQINSNLELPLIYCHIPQPDSIGFLLNTIDIGHKLYLWRLSPPQDRFNLYWINSKTNKTTLLDSIEKFSSGLQRIIFPFLCSLLYYSSFVLYVESVCRHKCSSQKTKLLCGVVVWNGFSAPLLKLNSSRTCYHHEKVFLALALVVWQKAEGSRSRREHNETKQLKKCVWPKGIQHLWRGWVRARRREWEKSIKCPEPSGPQHDTISFA